MQRQVRPRASQIYRAGKPVAQSDTSSSDSDSDRPEDSTETRTGADRSSVGPDRVDTGQNRSGTTQFGVRISDTARESLAKGAAAAAAEAAAAAARAQAQLSDEESSDNSGEDVSDDNASDYSGSSSDAQQRTLPRPVFKKVQPQSAAQDEKALAQEADERRIRARAQMQLAMERAATQGDDAAPIADVRTVDDTDGLDPDGEYELWKLRELLRIRRDRDKVAAAEQAHAEREARHGMDPEQRRLEDERRANESRSNKPKKKMAFMQKYYHKGAFFQDEEILQRDYSEPTELDSIDKAALPKPLQVRGDQLGRAGRSKWTHLANEDTTSRDAGWSKQPQKILKRLGGFRETLNDEQEKRRKSEQNM